MSLSHIAAPLSLVPLISFLVHDFSIAMLFSLLKVSLVNGSISLCLLSLSSDFTILELTLIPRSISHEQDTLAMLDSSLVVSLVLEERVVIGIHTLTFTQLCDWVEVSNVTLNNKTVK